MSKYTCFDVSIKDHVAHVVMNRPDEFNTMTRLFWKELPEIVKELDKNAEARVILLRGEGKHFNAGMDLANFTPADKSGPKKDPARMRETFYHGVLDLENPFCAVEEFRMTTIA